MNAVTPRHPVVLKLETGFIFLLGLAIFISKPLIYLSILLLIGVTLVRIATKQEYRHELFDNRLFWTSSGVFVFGLLATLIGSEYVEDVGWMAKKTMLLPMVVPLLMAFSQKINRIAAIAGVVMGFWIAFVLTGNMYNWTWSGDRYAGATWDVGMWGVVCAMLMALLTPMIFNRTTPLKWRALLVITFMGATVMLVTTGSRGPILGAAAGILIYLVFKQQKALIWLLATSGLILYALSIATPEQMNAFQYRAQSITNTQTDASNYIRLALWETGLAQIKDQLKNGDISLLVGSGHKGHEQISSEFYRKFTQHAKTQPGLLLTLGASEDKIVRDFHNMYIQSAVVTGIPWTTACIALIVFIGLIKPDRNRRIIFLWSTLPVSICYLITGVTYAILPHFALIIAIFYITILKHNE